MIRRGLIVAAFVVATPVQAETLPEAVAAAYATNPELAEAHARQDAREEWPEQARAQGRPTLSASADAGYDHLGYGKTGTAGLATAMPIWTGGRVSSAVRAATADVEAGRQLLRDREADVLERVVAAYAELLFSQQAVEVARVGIERLDRQVAEARSRFDLGEGTLTDVAQLQTQRATVVANLSDAEAALAGAVASYRAVIGHEPGGLAADTPSLATLPTSLADARLAAQDANPLLLQQRRTVEASEARIGQARAEGAPSLDLAGSYGHGAVLSGGSLHGYENAAAVGVTLRVPIFTGGLVSSRVREAEANTRAERYAVDVEERETIRAVDTAWASLQAVRERVKANEAGLEVAQLALKGVRAEYAYGLRTTVDILIAEQSLREAQLALARSHRDVLIAQAAVLRAAGRLDRAAYVVSE